MVVKGSLGYFRCGDDLIDAGGQIAFDINQFERLLQDRQSRPRRLLHIIAFSPSYKETKYLSSAKERKRIYPRILSFLPRNNTLGQRYLCGHGKPDCSN